MHLGHPLILIFAMVFEVVDLALLLLLSMQYLSVANPTAIRSSVWKLPQGIFFLLFQTAAKKGFSSKTLFVRKR